MVRNKSGVVVLTLSVLQPSPDRLVISCASMGGAEVAVVEMGLAEQFSAFVEQIPARSRNSGGLCSFVHSNGALIAGPLEQPQIEVSELLNWRGPVGQA